MSKWPLPPGVAHNLEGLEWVINYLVMIESTKFLYLGHNFLGMPDNEAVIKNVGNKYGLNVFWGNETEQTLGDVVATV